MSRYRYELDENHAIRAWDDENPNELNAPFLFQPTWPDGTAWANEEEATAWVELVITSLENPDSELLAGISPEQPTQPRVAPEEPVA